MNALKKILLIGLALLFVVSLAGCGNAKAVKEELCGTWGYYVNSINGPCYQVYTFNDDNTFEAAWINENAPSKSSESNGTYKIKGSQIVLTKTDGSVTTIIEYSLEDGVLGLVDKHSDNSGNRELIRLE